MMAAYPNVECLHHSPPAPGYAVCLHVLQGVEVGFFEPASDDDLGTIVCAACHARRHDRQYTEDNLSLTCVHCCREHGLLPKGRLH